MSEKRRGLGRGLGALIPSGPVNPTGDPPIVEKKVDDTQRPPERVKKKQTSSSSRNGRSSARSSGKQIATASKKNSKALGTESTANKAFDEETKVPARGSRSSMGKNQTAPKPRITADSQGRTQTEKSGYKDKSRPAPERKSATPSGGDSSEQSSVSRETPAKTRGKSKTAAQTGRGRRDMGQALRHTSSGRRPVDMFFLPADDESGAVTNGSSPEPATESSEEGKDVHRAETSVDVSRETSNEASHRLGLATPRPAMDLSGNDFALVSEKSDEGRAPDHEGQRVSSKDVTNTRQPDTAEPDGVPEENQRPSRTPTSVNEEHVSRETSSTDADPSTPISQDSSRDTVSVDSSKDSGSSDSSVELAAVPGAKFAEIDVKDIHPNRKQPRQVFDEDELAELAFSVKEIGVLQPVVVRPSSESEVAPYELVMGERRWRAVQKAGLSTIPAIIRGTSDDDLLRDALLENLHRSQLNPLEEAAAYQQLMEEFGATQDELSHRIGRSRPQISNTLRLLRLPPLVQRRVAAGVLSSGHARALLGLSDPADMERLAQQIVAEGMSVRATEEAVALSDGLKRRATKRKTAINRHDDRLNYIADAFSDRLDTSVKIQLGARKGKMTIEFASVEDLNRIIDVLDPTMDDRG